MKGKFSRLLSRINNFANKELSLDDIKIVTYDYLANKLKNERKDPNYIVHAKVASMDSAELIKAFIDAGLLSSAEKAISNDKELEKFFDSNQKFWDDNDPDGYIDDKESLADLISQVKAVMKHYNMN